jgi:hypothetical protein
MLFVNFSTRSSTVFSFLLPTPALAVFSLVDWVLRGLEREEGFVGV